MSYKLNPFLSKIESPVRLCFPNEDIIDFLNGSELAEAVFENRYVVKSLKAVGDKIEIELTKAVIPSMNAVSEEITFF